MDKGELEILRHATLFSGLSNDVLRDIVGNEPPRLYHKGKVVFQQGDDADHFYIILSGWVKLFRSLPSGEEAILHIFTKGESFAEAAMFGDHRYPATAEIVADARMLAINCNRFASRLQESPRIALRMLASTAVHLKQLVGEIEQIKGRNSTERLAYFLLNMCPDDSVSAVVRLPYEKSLIAARLGIQPESLSRILNKLRGYGVTSMKDQIVVSDIAALEKLVAGEDTL